MAMLFFQYLNHLIEVDCVLEYLGKDFVILYCD